MAEFPALPLWTDAYLADTRHLSTIEHGAYLLLLMEAWRRPTHSLPDDDRMLARLAGLSGDEWADMREVIMAFWVRDGRSKTWTQKRLSKERQYVVEKSRLQRDRIAKRWKRDINEDTAVIPEGIPDGYRIDTPTPTPTPTPNSDVLHTSRRAKRGTRLKDDWIPGPLPGSVAALVAQWPPGRELRELEQFRDYWTSRSSNAAKLDWDRTWHNRIRDQHDRIMKEKGNGRFGGNGNGTRTGDGFLDACVDAATGGSDWHANGRDGAH